MHPPDHQSRRVSVGKIFYGALMALILLYFVAMASVDSSGGTTAERSTGASPASAPEVTWPPDLEPSCYEIYKFCVDLMTLEDEVVGSDGLPVDEGSEEPSWRMVTANLHVSLKSGESRGTFTDASVALVDTAGVRHGNDNRRVGLTDQGVVFDRTHQMTTSVTVVFLLDEEEVECVEITGRYTNQPLCLRP